MTISYKAGLLISISALPLPVVAQAQPAVAGQATTAQTRPMETPSTASPQGPAQVGDATSSHAEPGQEGLQDIIVTAQQRGENLQKAAVPVAAVSGADLINSGIRGVDTLGRLVPALVVNASSQGNLIFIRGVGNFSFTSNSDPAAAYNVDGVYIGRSSATFGTFYDLERVEVLKGPQGTLYGRNATAGAINIIPVQPKYGQTSGYATASYGNYDAVNLEGALNVGLGDNAGFRLSGTYSKQNGFNRDGTLDDDQAAIRAQIKVDLTPDITVRVAGDYAQVRGKGSSSEYYGKYAFVPATGKFVITPANLPLGEGVLSAVSQNYRVTNGLAGTIAGRALDTLDVPPYIRNSNYGFGVHADWRTPIGTFSIIPAYRISLKNNLSTGSANEIGVQQDADQFSVEARLVSNPGGTLDYILGAYYFNEQLHDYTISGASTQQAYTTAHYSTASPAAYGRLTLHATDWLRFTGGIRYTEDHKEFNNSTTLLAVLCPSASPAVCSKAPLIPYADQLSQLSFVPAASGQTVVRAPGVLIARSDSAYSGKLDTSKITYRGAIEIDAGPQSLLYASIETGYRAGGFNSGFNYNPENITAYTIGSKNRFLNNRLQLNLELFDWEYRDQQLTYLGVNPFTGAVQVLTANVGRSSIKGVEVEGRALITPTTTVSANVQYTDANYKSFVYTTPARPFTGCNVTQTTVFTVNCSGFPAINAPKWTINLGGEQVITVGDYQITLAADTQYRSGRYVGFEYIAPEYVDHSWSTNAQVSFGARGGRYVASGFIRNIENNRVVITGGPAPATNLVTQTRGAPRTYGVRLSARF